MSVIYYRHSARCFPLLFLFLVLLWSFTRLAAAVKGTTTTSAEPLPGRLPQQHEPLKQPPQPPLCRVEKDYHHHHHR